MMKKYCLFLCYYQESVQSLEIKILILTKKVNFTPVLKNWFVLFGFYFSQKSYLPCKITGMLTIFFFYIP